MPENHQPEEISISPAREKLIRSLVERVMRERRAQITGGADNADRCKSMNSWVAIMTRHLGLAVSDMGAPAEHRRFEKQLIRVAALALAALEFSNTKELAPKEGNEGRTNDKD